MHKFFISQYINKISVEDVKDFALKNNILLSEEELQLIYHTLQQNWETVLYQDPTPVFERLKGQLSPDSYQKGIQLFEKYHNLYKDYL